MFDALSGFQLLSSASNVFADEPVRPAAHVALRIGLNLIRQIDLCSWSRSSVITRFGRRK